MQNKSEIFHIFISFLDKSVMFLTLNHRDISPGQLDSYSNCDEAFP